MSDATVYILEKSCKYHINYTISSRPLAASHDYQKICEYAKKLRDDILEHGDPEDYPKEYYEDFYNEPLYAWDGFGYYAVGVNDQSCKIIFRILTIPMIENGDIRGEERV